MNRLLWTSRARYAGIFGGQGGAVLQALTDNLTVPYVITLHTETGYGAAFAGHE